MLSIAPFKSIVAPDVDGDRAYNILTHSTRVGVARIANGTSLCLLLNCVQAMLTIRPMLLTILYGSEPGRLPSSNK